MFGVDLKIIGMILGSTLLGTMITALFTKRNADKNYMLQYIVQERKKWRDDIRTETGKIMYVVNVHSMRKYQSFLAMRLNPIEDRYILEQLERVIETNGANCEWEIFLQHIAVGFVKGRLGAFET